MKIIGRPTSNCKSAKKPSTCKKFECCHFSLAVAQGPRYSIARIPTRIEKVYCKTGIFLVYVVFVVGIKLAKIDLCDLD